MRTYRRWPVGGLIALFLAVVTVGCGGAQPVASGTATTTRGRLANLDIIDRDALVRAAGAEFASGTSGQELRRDDGVRTNGAGFAEVTYFEGSLVRLDHDSAFTVVELSDAPAAHVMHGRIDDGSQSWQRVEKLGEKDSFVVDTPVGSASVRGTAFAIDCTATDQCAFSVVEGTVEVRALDGTVASVHAGETLTVKKNQPLPRPDSPGVDELRARPWIAKNLARDEKVHPGQTPPDRPPTGSSAPAPDGASTASGPIAPGASTTGQVDITLSGDISGELHGTKLVDCTAVDGEINIDLAATDYPQLQGYNLGVQQSKAGGLTQYVTLSGAISGYQTDPSGTMAGLTVSTGPTTATIDHVVLEKDGETGVRETVNGTIRCD